jgi:outer membrane protein
MTMGGRRVGAVVIGAFAISFAATVAHTQADIGKPLTLGDCVVRALAHGFDMELQLHDLEIAKDDLPIARSAFHPIVAADAGTGSSRVPQTTESLRTRSDTVDTRLGVAQRFWPGTIVSFSSDLNRLTAAPSLSDFNPSYSSGVTLNLTQPLMRGFGGINTVPIRRAELALDIAERSYRDRALDVIQATEGAFYLLAGARDQVSVFRVSLQLAETLLKEAEGRHRAGMATKLDLLQAQVGIANARLNLLQAEKTVKSSEDGLLALIGQFQLDEPLGPAVIDETEPTRPPNVDESYALALESQPAYRNARAVLELTKLQLLLAKDDLKPSLDLGLSVDLGGEDRSRRGAFDDAFDSERSAWQVGLSATYPIGRVGEKARYRQSRTALSRGELALHQLEQEILVNVRTAARNVETAQESVKIAALAANLADQQRDAENRRFRAGLSTSRRVLEAQTDLERARVAELQAKLDLRIAYSALYRIEGSALDRYGIALNPNTEFQGSRKLSETSP